LWILLIGRLYFKSSMGVLLLSKMAGRLVFFWSLFFFFFPSHLHPICYLMSARRSIIDKGNDQTELDVVLQTFFNVQKVFLFCFLILCIYRAVQM
jgi:hypothetical protein